MRTLTADAPELCFVGALDVERTPAGVIPRRLPAWTRPQLTDPLTSMVVPMPSGVRLRFDTTSDCVEIDAQLTTFRLKGNPLRSMSFDVVVDGELCGQFTTNDANCLVVDLADRANVGFEAGPLATVRFSGLGAHRKTVEVWLPQSAAVEVQQVRVDDGSLVECSAPSTAIRWAHYGSSISHCMEADRPTGVWPVVAARLAGVELTNFGLAGSCHLDQYVARTLRDLPMDVLTMKVGINIVNGDSLRERTFAPALHGFLDTVRDGHPTLPIVVISPIVCPPAEDQPGPTLPGPDGKFFCAPRTAADSVGSMSLSRVREIVAAVVAQRAASDPNLRYVDGLTLFGPDDAGDLPDALHPSSSGYQRMGERFHSQVLGPLLATMRN